MTPEKNQHGRAATLSTLDHRRAGAYCQKEQASPLSGGIAGALISPRKTEEMPGKG
jgi:hypothetical protein